jgi:hypothetical protein
MLGKIIGITDSIVSVHLDINIYDYDNLISKNVVFRDNNIISVGEVIGIDNGIMNAALVGEIKDNKFLYGDISKPSFKGVKRCKKIIIIIKK